MRLNKLQEMFKQNLLGRGLPDEHFSALFVSDAVGIHDRLDIYCNNVFKSLGDIIFKTYPVTVTLTGEKFMRRMADDFIRAAPPLQANMTLYGGGFADFIAGYPPAAALPYLPDVARMEWAWHEAYHAPDDNPLDLQDLQKTPEQQMERLSFKLRASCRLIDSAYPLVKIRNFCLAKNPAESKLEISGQPSCLLVFRPELETFFVSLSREEYYFLTALANGETLRRAASLLALGDDPEHLAGTLEKFFHAGIFSTFSC